MVYLYTPCNPCCSQDTAATHRLIVNLTGVETWHKDHGNTVRGVRCFLESSDQRYFIAGLRSGVATARKLNDLGTVLWSVDHGDDCYGLDVDLEGKLHTAGKYAESVATHRRYSAAGALELSIDARPFDAGVAVDPDGKIWAFKTEIGGTDPLSLGDVFRYDFSKNQLGTLDSEGGFVDHDNAGSAYVFHTRASLGDTVSKYTAGVSDWTATRSDTPASAMSMAVDRDLGEVYTCCRVGASNATLVKFLDDGTEDWSFNIGTASTQVVGAMAARVGHVFYSRNTSTSGIIGRIDTDGTGNTTVLTGAFGTFTGWLEIDSTGDILYAVVGTSGNADLFQYDATGATLSANWSDSTISYTRISLNETAGIIAGCGSGSDTLVALDLDGNVLWSVDEGNTIDVCVTDDFVITTGSPNTASRCGIVHVYDHDGNLLWVRNPKRNGSGSAATNQSISSNNSEIVLSFVGDYGAKIFNSDGTLYDFYGRNVQAVAFDDAGFTYISASTVGSQSAIVKKFDNDTWICEWFANFPSVDLGIGSDYRVLTGTGATLRQLSSAGVSQWTAATGGTIRSVALDSSNNAFVAHAHDGNISHRKYESSGAPDWFADHGGGLYGIRIDSSDKPFIGGVRVEA